MDKLPPEVLENIFNNLKDFRDSGNVNKTCKTWREILTSSRSEWMFGHALPVVVEHLTKWEIISCRQVCKQWRGGVDHFLENNACHRPALEEILPTENYKTDQRHKSMERILDSKYMTYIHSDRNDLDKMGKVLREARENPNFCLVGRSASFTVESWQSRDDNDTQHITKCLAAIGNRIWFLKIFFNSKCPFITLRRVMTWMLYLPNLKKLELEVLGLRNETHYLPGCHPSLFKLDDPKGKSRTGQQVLDYKKQFHDRYGKRRLPKLETISIFVYGDCPVELGPVFLDLLQKPTLQSLSLLCKMPGKLDMSNVVDFSVDVDSDAEALVLLKMKSPIRRIALTVFATVSAKLIFEILKHFQGTLRNVLLKLMPTNFQGRSISVEEMRSKLEPFISEDTMMDFPNLKRLTFQGCRPISFNFLFGLRKSLEYLHFELDFSCKDYWPGYGIDDHGVSERLDLLSTLETLESSKHKVVLETYTSTMWKHFPKLKIFSVYENEYRRDVFDKMFESGFKTLAYFRIMRELESRLGSN